ncbi:amidohydrolase family protein [Sphingomonas sp. BIUV-7]|uniref:Amidohydrolase family protein n=1 Tax=Sphingomonas natans TaxID=3063330 RepID=A0ABT8Y5C9_9SPHN|nr:amidohydrolase family protein [Sphingomonas sp. BIUV-7]MDO6413525.1 amidohydrolase family protein [Sphingomonas sp. BIUV-7]
MKSLALLVAALLAGPAVAETVAFTGGTVAIGDGSQPIPNGTVVIRDGRVIAAGTGVAVPAGARTVDATGKWVTAGIVSGASTLALLDGYGMEETNDTTTKGSPFSAAIDIATSLNPTQMRLGVERSKGVTRAVVIPAAGNTMFGGQGAVIDLGADLDPVTRARAFQYVELGEAATKTGGGSRPAAHVLLRAALEAARNPALASGLEKDVLVTRADAAALLPVVEGRTPLLVHAERATDILAALALVREFPKLKLVLLGATEGWLVADRIAAARVPVIAAALTDLPENFEQLAATQSNVGRMAKAGVSVAISTQDASEGPYESYLKQYAGNLVALTRVDGATGLDWGQAFATITSRPALALGLDGEIGSLRPGRRADVVVWDGDPLEVASAALSVWIDGVQQPAGSRQTRLRDRYANPVEGALPKAYDQ